VENRLKAENVGRRFLIEQEIVQFV